MPSTRQMFRQMPQPVHFHASTVTVKEPPLSRIFSASLGQDLTQYPQR